MTSDRGLWIGVAIGGPIVVLGLLDVLGDSSRTRPAELVWWLLGGLVAVDLLVIPLALAAGRVVRRPLWRWAVSASLTVVVVGWPYVQGWGRRADNPSLLPRDYGLGVTVAVAGVWVAAFALSRARSLRGGWRGGGGRSAEP